MSLIAEENAGHARRRRLIESLIETMGSLLGIARCTVPRTPMEPLSHARVTIEGGVDGDLRGKPGPRQVTIIADSSWSDACAELEANLQWTTRRATLLVGGIDLRNSAGATIRIGELTLEVTAELGPCGLMDKFHQGLRKALMPHWRGGVSCRVIASGAIRIGDPVLMRA